MAEVVGVFERRWRGPGAEASARTAGTNPPTDVFDILIMAGLVGLVVFAPIVMGAVAPWARSVVFCTALTLLALWLIQGVRRGRLRIARTWLWLFVSLFFAIAAIQLIPLSPGLLSAISPGTAETYREVAQNGLDGARSLSLFPYATRTEILRFGALAMIFLVVSHTVRTRRQAAIIIMALVAVGVFEALYGMGEHFSGGNRVFWHARTAHLAAATGTFLNKNHFAGLLEMILPATLGLLLGILPRRRSGGSARVRIVEALSSREIHVRLFLTAAAVMLAVAICFSLSRAGVLSMLISLIVLAVCLGLSAGFRKYTLLLLAVVMAILLVAAVIGAEIVVERVEEAAAGRSASWIDRLDLSRSGIAQVRQFPLLGTGLGSFRYAFERFQSPRFDNRIADFLHNDWLQVFCEMGFVGGVLVALGFLVFIITTARIAFSRRDAFCRWVSLGALLGVGAMLIHSLFDYNLLKITSNGVVFATLLGLSFAVVRMPSERRGSAYRGSFFTLSLGPAPVRIGLAVMVAAGWIALTAWPLRLARADIAFNRFLVCSEIGEADRYFFIPLRKTPFDVNPTDSLARARELAPSNPRYHFFASYYLVKQADGVLHERARETLRKIMGPERIEQSDPEVVNRLVRAVAGDLGKQESRTRAELLALGEKHLRRALARLDISAEYHLLMARILADRPEAEALPARDPRDLADAVRCVRRAFWLAPNRPYVLLEGGKVLLKQALLMRDPQEQERQLQEVCKHFKRAIFSYPACADEIYAIVRGLMKGPKRTRTLLAVTPPTLRAHEQLAGALWEAGEWKELLACLDKIDELAADKGEREAAASGVSLLAQSSRVMAANPYETHASGARAYDVRRPLSVRLDAAERRYKVLGILGQWEERAKLTLEAGDLLGECAASDLDRIRRLRAKGRLPEALTICMENLQRNFAHPEALLAAAELASTPGKPRDFPRWQEPLDHLYRLIINHDALSADVYERAEAIASRLALKEPGDILVRDFVLGAGAILAGRPQAGVAILEKAVSDNADVEALWQQAHLLWYYLGLGYEEAGRREEALSAYRRVIKIVPAHRPALLRLAALDSDNEAIRNRLAAWEPQVPFRVNFGGKLILLGYSLDKECVPVTVNGIKTERELWFITYYWQAHERLLPQYRPVVHFCDENWTTLFRNDHRIRNGAKEYESEYPYCGEVIIDRWGLDQDFGSVRYLRLCLEAPAAPRLLPKRLFADGLCTFVPARLEIPEDLR